MLGEDAGEDKRAQGRTLVHHGLVVYIFTYKKPPHKILPSLAPVGNFIEIELS